MHLRRTAFTLTELSLCLAVIAIAMAVALPVLASARQSGAGDVSITNLVELAIAHDMYAADWNGRQVTLVPEDFSAFGSTGESANASYNGTGTTGIALGWGINVHGNEGLFGYWPDWHTNGRLYEPINFTSGFGWFRLPNALPLQAYAGGRFFSDVFYSPADTVPYSLAAPEFDTPHSFAQVLGSNDAVWSTYCWSAAALYKPDVLRAQSAGGFINPFDDETLPLAFAVPPLHAAAYPDLKTHMLEHHWLQGAPGSCNPAFDEGTFDGCEPYYFNHGIDSAPVTLFYDASVRLLPNGEVQASDQQVLAGTAGVDGLWSRDTSLGPDGYFLNAAFDNEADVSHHVLTTDGILGRDTLGPGVNGPRRASSFGPRRGRRAAPERSAAGPGPVGAVIDVEP